MESNNQTLNNLAPIPLSRPTLGEEEVEAAAAVIRSGWISQGEVVRRFEQAFAEAMGVGQAVSTSSGTAALHLVLVALGIGPSDEVILPSFVCSALLNAVFYTGATPVLAEIHPDTYNLDADEVKQRLSRRTRAVIVPHMFGLPADLDPLLALDVPIIEDCAQAVGATYRGRPVGSFGHAAIFSFYATKVMATGEGGMVVSNCEKLITAIRDLNEYDRQSIYITRYNYKMTDLQAAVGLAQLKKLEGFARRRREIADAYRLALQAMDIGLPVRDPGHIYFRYVIDSRSDVQARIEGLRQQGIGCDRPIFMPLHRLLNRPGYPLTERCWENALSLPIYPSLTPEELDRILHAITRTSRSQPSEDPAFPGT